MDFRIYPLKDTSRLPELCELFAKGLAETTPEYWLWKHYSDCGLPQGMVLVAEDETGKLRAIFAMQPAWYRRGEDRIMLVQLEDLVIDPDCRGQGLMRKLYSYTVDYYRNEGATGLVGLSANDKSYAVLTKYGFQNLGDFKSITTPKTIVPLFLNIKSYDADGWKIEICDTIPGDLLFTDRQDVFKLEKNQQFMQWRFANNPEHSYQWLTIRHKGAMEGYIVFYVNYGRLRSAVNICDWELTNTVSDDILKAAVDILRSKGNWVNLWGRTDEQSAARWQRAGMTQQGAERDYFIYCPMDDHSIPENWHITKADSDN